MLLNCTCMKTLCQCSSSLSVSPPSVTGVQHNMSKSSDLVMLGDQDLFKTWTLSYLFIIRLKAVFHRPAILNFLISIFVQQTTHDICVRLRRRKRVSE